MRWRRIGVAAFIAALAIGLALSLGLWGQWTASAQDTFVVNDDTTPTEGGWGTPDFETEDIEDATDGGRVADGDTLVICEGTYNPPDAIEVTKALTIEGRAEASRDDIVVEGVAGADGFVVSEDGVTVRHLKLVGTGGTVAGIRTRADDATMQDLEITAWELGVWMEGQEDNVLETSNVHDNTQMGV